MQPSSTAPSPSDTERLLALALAAAPSDTAASTREAFFAALHGHLSATRVALWHGDVDGSSPLMRHAVSSPGTASPPGGLEAGAIEVRLRAVPVDTAVIRLEGGADASGLAIYLLRVPGFGVLEMTAPPFADALAERLTAILQRLGASLTLLRRSSAMEPLFTELFETAHDGILIFTPDGVIEDANEAALYLLGYDRDALLATPLAALHPASAQTSLRLALEGILESGQYTYEITFQRSTSDTFTAEVAASAVTVHGRTIIQASVRDITERRRVELELQESLVRLFTVIETVEEGITLRDASGRFRIFNSKMQDITGYHIDEANEPGFLERIYPDDDERTLSEARLMGVEQGELLRNVETRIRTATGEYRTLLVSTTRVLEQEDALFLSTFRDITDRKRAEQEISSLKAFYEQILDNVPAQIAVLDPDGTYRYLNPQAVADPETRAWARGQSDRAFCERQGLPPAVADQREAFMERVVAEASTFHFEERIPGTRGDRHFLRYVSPVLTPDGAVEHVISYGLDITERKHAQEALEHRVALEELVADLSTQFISTPTASMPAAIQEGLARAGRFAGADRAYLYLPGHSGLDYAHGWDADGHASRADASASLPHQGAFLNRLADGHPVLLHDLCMLADADRAGAPLIADASVETMAAVPLLDGGRFAGFIGLDALAAPQPWGENVLLMLRLLGDVFFNALQRMQVEQELREAKQAAEELAVVKDQFLASMSHEIRTPLNAVIGITDLLTQTNPREDQLNYLRAITFSAQNLLALINDILDFSKIGSDMIEFESVEIELDDVLEGIDAMFRLKAEDRGLALSFHRADNVPGHLLGDKVRLNQILVNLISNALKFTEEGGIVVRVALDARDAEMAMLAFSVQDTGIGIPADKLESIFDSFTQASTSTTRKYGGTGLGLAIARELVERQGGDVWVESEEGVGSTFHFTLPMLIGEAPAAPKAAEAVSAAGDAEALVGRRVLLVEDNEFNRMVAEGMLRRWGADVDSAVDGADGIAAAQARPYAAILMDIRMPNVDGLQATRQIRADAGPNQHTPILALTADAMADLREEAMACGMDDFIPKPFVPKDLLHSLLRVLPALDPADTADATADAPPPTDSAASDTEPVEPAGAPEPAAGLDAVADAPPMIDIKLVEANAFGNPALVLRMVTLFLQLTPDHLARLEAAAGTSDWDEVAFVAHKMKSAIKMFGAADLGRRLDAVEHHIRKEAAADAEFLAAEVQHILRDGARAIAEVEALEATLPEG